MKSTRRIVVLCVLVLVLLATVLVVSSCAKAESQGSGATTTTTTTTDNNGAGAQEACNHKLERVGQKDATCEEDGATGQMVCSECGYVAEESTVIGKLHHLNTTSYVYPTATKEGSKTSVCDRCGKEETITLQAFGATLPQVSEALSDIIGNLSASIEILEDSELVYVSEPASSYSDGVKKSIFFEVAEAELDGTAEVPYGHLTLKVGFAEAVLTGVVPSEEVIVDKENAEYFELSVYLNGEDVSFALNGEGEQSIELSNSFAQMLGYSDYEDLMETAYATQGMTEVLPLVEKLLTDVSDGAGVVSSNYMGHLEDLFELLGEDIVTESTKDGTTVYDVNPEALKALLADIDDKTVAEYLEEMYGENVVEQLTSFVTDLPNKTVKDISKMAVSFADAAGVEIEEIYTMIDLYVYYAIGEEFSIETEIYNRYDMTVAEIIAELNGYSEEETSEFIDSINASLEDAAETLTSVTVEEILSSMFGFYEDAWVEEIESLLDMVKDAADVNVSVDQNGTITGFYAAVEGNEIEYTFANETATLKVLVDGYMEYLFTLEEDAIDFKITADGKSLANGNLSITESGNTTDITANLYDDNGNEMLYYSVTITDGELTDALIVVRGYDYGYDGEYLVTVAEISYEDTGNSSVMTVVTENTSIGIGFTDGAICTEVSVDGDISISTSLTYTDTSLQYQIWDTENQLLDAFVELNAQRTMIQRAWFVVNVYEVHENGYKDFQEYLNVSYDIDNASGMDYVRVVYQGVEYLLGYELGENGVSVVLTDGEEFTLAELTLTADGDSASTKVVLMDETFADLTLSLSGDTLTIDVDRLVLGGDFYEDCYTYIQLDGAIKVALS